MLKRIQHPFQSARSDFQGARNEFQGAQSNFQAAKIDFQGAKIDFQAAKSWNHQNSVGSIRFTGYICRCSENIFAAPKIFFSVAPEIFSVAPTNIFAAPKNIFAPFINFSVLTERFPLWNVWNRLEIFPIGRIQNVSAQKRSTLRNISALEGFR